MGLRERFCKHCREILPDSVEKFCNKECMRMWEMQERNNKTGNKYDLAKYEREIYWPRKERARQILSNLNSVTSENGENFAWLFDKTFGEKNQPKALQIKKNSQGDEYMDINIWEP